MPLFKKSITLLLLFLSVNLFAQTTPIPDVNFEQFLFDQGIDTNGVNGNILDVDAEAVTNLNVTRNDVTDFTGIEAFINIETLNLGTNDFDTIQLNTLSLLRDFRINNTNNLSSLDFTQNPDLESIYIRTNSNEPLVTLSELDLSQNLKLVRFQVLIMESLSSVIFPVTDTIEEIRLSVVAIPVIDLSQISGEFLFRIVTSRVDVNIIYPNDNMALKSLELNSIDFPSVDVSSQIGLERFTLSSTYTENFILPTTNTLTNIRISGHELNVPISFASVPELTNLSISNNFGTVPLEIDVSQNLELTNLSLSRNNMVNLDVSQNTKLTNLDVNTNNFTSIDVLQNLLLEDLDVSSNQLPVLDVQVNTELTRLEADNNLLPSIDLTQNTLLRYLYLGFNQLPNLDITQNTELWILGINNNLFTGAGLDLSQNIELFNMNISNNQVETLDFSNTVMRNLNISYNIFPGNQVLNDFYTKIESRANLSDVVLRANNNLLTGTVPDFYSIYTDNDPTTIQHRRWSLHIENNYFHFGDFENEHLGYVSLLTTQSIGPSPSVVMQDYTYAPQEKVNTIENPSRNAGESITLITDVRGEQNHYKWFKDGLEITDVPDSPELVLTDLDTCDEGVYYAEITSDLVPFENANAPGTNGKNLLLVRNDITLTVNATKECVTLDMPLTNVPINSGIEWNDTPGACGYKINVGTAPGGTDVVNNEDVGEVTVYNFPSDLNPNQDYFVTLTPYYDDGDFTGCAEQSFRTNSTTVAPDCTSLSSSLAGRNDVAVDTNIEWEPANGADNYIILVGTTPGGTEIFTGDVGNNLFYDPSADFTEGGTIYVTVIPENTEGQTTGCSEDSFTVISSAIAPTPPACTSLTSPTGTDVAIGTTQMTWNAVTDATGYRITITGTANNDVTDVEVAGTAYTFTGAFVNGETATVTIIPFNITVDATGCSSESFTIEAATTPTLPSCTTISTPLNNATYISPGTTISWNAVADADGYRITSTSTSGRNEVTDIDLTTTTWDPVQDYDYNDTVTITIVPYNSSGSAIGCTAESFTTAGVPACTTLSSPLRGATGVSIATDLNWNASPNATGYRLTVGTSTGGNDILDNFNVGNLLTYNLPNDLPENTQIYVTIVPYNPIEIAFACFEESFTTETATPPTAPACTSLTSPAGTDVAIGTTQMTWNAVTNATGYRITITGTANNDVTDVEVTSTAYTYTSAFVNGETATVTIIPFNGIVDATWCAPETFTIEAATTPTAPACTTLTSPAGTNVAIGTTQMTWNAVTDATGYRITITGTANNNVTDIEVTGTSYDFTGAFVNGETATVTIIPFNGTVDAAGCTTESFTIEIAAPPTVPECTSLVMPNNGDINIELSTSISWEEIANVEGYRLSIGTTSGGTDIVDDEDVGIITSFSFTENLMPNTTYFVRITPYNTNDNASDCEEYSFSTIRQDETLYGLSPNGDGINDFWAIDGIEEYPVNVVTIYNRWGDMVFQIKNYDNASNVFSGTANMKTKIGADQLPTSTYFFNIEIEGETILRKTQGFLVLKR